MKSAAYIAIIAAVALAAGCGPRGEQAALKNGIQAYRDKDYARAAELLAGAAQRITGSAELYYYLGSARLARGELDAANEAFNAALDCDPLHGESMAGMGEAAFLKGELPKARGLFEQALKSNLATAEARAVALNGLALACRESKDPARALLCLVRAEKLMPSYAPTHYNLACLERDDYQMLECACDSFNIFLRLAGKGSPYAEKARTHLARLSQVIAQKRAAREAEAPERDSAAAQKALEEGIKMQSAGRLPAACKAYRAALAADPLLFNAAWGWGIVASRLALRVEALDAFRKAAELKPEYIDAYLGAAEQAFQMRRWDEAEKLVANVFARSPAAPAASEMMIRIRFAQKRYADVHEYGACYLSLLKPEDPNYSTYEKWLKTVPEK